MSQEAYLPFHRKYRPKKFSEYIGNKRMKESLLTIMRGEVYPQVILFSGTAGTGKTTMARLLASEYRCENRDPITGACGECHSCLEMKDFIETGNSGMVMNVYEVDVTSDGGKAKVSELLEEASAPSFDGSWKIFILDECHMMTTAAQNRLLKNLEEPAEKVLMLLCTTDPQKLLDTIHSRCQYRFMVEKPNRDELAGLLARICKSEGVKFDARALSLICVHGEFTQRKSLIALERVIREKGDVTYENTVEVLDIIADSNYYNFYELLLADNIDIYKYINFISNLKTKVKLDNFVSGLLSYTMRGIYVISGVNVEALDNSEILKYKKLFSKFSPADIAYLLNLLLSLRSDVDIEARLLLMGYTGLKRRENQHQEEDKKQLVDESLGSVAKEKKEASQNYLDSITATPEDKEKFIENNLKEITADDLAQMFQGEKIQL